MPTESMLPLEVVHTAEQDDLINKLVRHDKNENLMFEFRQLVEEDQV